MAEENVPVEPVVPVEYGVIEMKEAICAALRLSQIVVKNLKDGVSWTDAVTVVTAAFGDEMVKAGLSGISKVVTEAKDLKGSEYAELINAALPELFALIAVISGSEK